MGYPVAGARRLLGVAGSTMLRSSRGRLFVTLTIACLVTSACTGPQSALDPTGHDAVRIERLFIWMAAGGVLLWLFVVGLAMWLPGRVQRSERTDHLLIAGGIALPLLVLTPLLAFGLAGIPPMLAPAPGRSLVIEVVGQQWWWRVRYLRPGHPPLDTANELRLPAGRRIDVHLTSADVIHSFWIPSLAGKMDMIPGRINRLPVQPLEVGVFRGACAEFCGTSHARMNLEATVLPQAEFDAWIARESADAAAPASDAAARGREAFLRHGCATCHTIRGTEARGVTGPDLTHVGARRMIAAGQRRTDVSEVRDWIAHTKAVKPEARMPAFSALPDDTLTALASYLVGLQ